MQFVMKFHVSNKYLKYFLAFQALIQLVEAAHTQTHPHNVVILEYPWSDERGYKLKGKALKRISFISVTLINWQFATAVVVGVALAVAVETSIAALRIDWMTINGRQVHFK